MSNKKEKEYEKIIAEITLKIIEVARPIRIILFGSVVRGQMGQNSDLDFLVVLNNSAHCRKTAQNIYKHLIKIGFATDLVVIHESDLLSNKDSEGTVIKTALQEGKVLYAA
ncbi:MAG: nucleotidyltransferase domain-containing protein [Oligoflexia bacterium]|nr:nucleotidyltransferase domain-containing protein [Oligoflexia bacterium]